MQTFFRDPRKYRITLKQRHLTTLQSGGAYDIRRPREWFIERDLVRFLWI